MKRINFQHVNNMRDLGGYPTNGGAYTAYGRLLRSDAPVKLTEDEIQWLRGMNIRTVIDLRVDGERDRNPNPLQNAPGFSYHHFAMDAYAVRLIEENDMPRLYMAMAGDKPVMRNIMGTIANADAGALFHCVAGKDRTGVVSALLLSLAGVDRSDIMADYQVSYTYIKTVIADWNQDFPDWPAFISRSDSEYMERFLDMFRDAYGSTERYLLEMGLSEEDIGKLKSKLL